MNSRIKNRILAVILTLGLILIAIFSKGLYSPNLPSALPDPSVNLAEERVVRVVSTNPANLEGAIILPTQTIEITFNKPMVIDNPRVVLDPKADYSLEQSPDHKTLKITPKDSFGLGKSFTLTIKSGYGTDTGEKLDQDLIFHFKTISYNGV